MDGAACLEKQKLRERCKGVTGACREKAETGGSGGVISLEITSVSGGNVSEGPGPFSRAIIIKWESHSTAAGRSSRINRVVVFIESPLPH